MDYIKPLFENLTTFSGETNRNALAKCKEFGFDPTRGEIPLEESFINLLHVKATLIDSIEKKKLIQLPITIQKNIFGNVESIIKQLESLSAGTDQVVNLVNSIEQLNFMIWQYGFHNLSDQVLGYSEKMNQLKNQQVRIEKMISEIDQGIQKKTEFEKLLTQITTRSEAIATISKTTQENSESVGGLLQSATENNLKINAILATVQQIESTSSQLVNNSKTSNSEIQLLETRIKDFSNEINTHEEMMSKTSDNSKAIIDDNNVKTEKIIKRLEAFTIETEVKINNLFKRILDLLPGATSAGLASAFQDRKKIYKGQMQFWTVIRFISILGFVLYGIIVYLDFTRIIDATAGKSLLDLVKTWFFYVANKSPIIVGLVLLEEFSRRTYNKLFKLEEDYTHKQVVSQSFEGYKNQLKELGEENSKNVLLNMLCQNVIEAISKNPIRLLDEEQEKGTTGLLSKTLDSK